VSSHPVQPIDAASLSNLVEAALFIGGPPLQTEHLCELIPGVDKDKLVAAIAQLNQQYHRQGRPYEIRRVGSGYQMMLRPRFFSVASRLRRHSREVRLSQAAVEVLALVAYRQPVTPHQIDAIRGTDSSAILRQLRRRNLIEPVDQPEGSRTIEYKTTRRFLELFRLTNLDDLPRVQELDQPPSAPSASPSVGPS
jgi:segregation and condensation protein B